MNLGEINQKLEATGFWKKFPPKAPRDRPGGFAPIREGLRARAPGGSQGDRGA
jgi:hypothetical protein